jgi:1,4-dihydroxy-6-naphthoate synthase
MGDQYGPMVVTRQPMSIEQLVGKRIAIPGRLTTAFLALQLLLGKGTEARVHEGSKPSEARFQFQVVEFDQIIQHVREGKSDAGLIIHEGQLTFAQSGLHLVVDLGAWWHEKTGLPLPLGGNCIRRDLGPKVCQEVTDILKRSIRYSLDHREQAVKYALRFGRDLDEELADRFVGMYVNDWTLDYGPKGREAISRLLQKGAEAGLVPHVKKLEFITARDS